MTTLVNPNYTASPGSFIKIYGLTSQVDRESENTAADENYTNLASFTIPGGAVKSGDTVFFEYSFSQPNSASTKRYRLRLNDNTIRSTSFTTVQTYHDRTVLGVHSAGQASAMSSGGASASGSFGTSTASAVSLTENFNNDVTVNIQVSWGAAASGETITLNSFICYVIR